jgi:hypothetical protein
MARRSRHAKLCSRPEVVQAFVIETQEQPIGLIHSITTLAISGQGHILGIDRAGLSQPKYHIPYSFIDRPHALLHVFEYSRV